MNKKLRFTLTLVVIAIVFAGVYALYNTLSSRMDVPRLAQQTAPTQAPAEADAPQTDSAETAGSPEATDVPKAPDFTVLDASGAPVQLTDYFGKPIVLNFWASWCGPCQSEMPDFQSAYERYGEDIHFLMVNLTDGSRETVEKATAYIEEQGYTFPVLFDTESDGAATYGVMSIPSTYFIDAQGYPVAQAAGALDMETLETGIGMIA